MTFKHCVYDNSRSNVTLHVARGLAKKITHVVITLDLSDTYTVEFIKVGRGAKMLDVKKVAEFSGVYADSLRSIVERTTGFALSL